MLTAHCTSLATRVAVVALPAPRVHCLALAPRCNVGMSPSQLPCLPVSCSTRVRALHVPPPSPRPPPRLQHSMTPPRHLVQPRLQPAAVPPAVPLRPVAVNSNNNNNNNNNNKSGATPTNWKVSVEVVSPPSTSTKKSSSPTHIGPALASAPLLGFINPAVTDAFLQHPVAASTAVLTGGTGLAVGGWAALNYHVCQPNQYLVRTGLGIDDVLVSKSGVRWPFQKAMIVDVNPTTYLFRLHNMSKGKVEFELPVVMTIGPQLPDVDPEAFSRYCKLLQDMDAHDIETTVKGIIEGETRGLTAELSVEEMFSGKEVFRTKVIQKLEPDLRKLGVTIYNANIQEMKDYDANNKYFEYRKKRAIEMANNEAREDVAKARKLGDVAVSTQERDTRIAVVQNEKQAKVEEYQRRQEMLVAEAEMAKQEALTKQTRDVTLIRADQAVEIQRQELQKEIEQKRFEQRMQAERSERLAPALADAEAKERLAEAALYTKTKEAEGIQKLMEAQAQGVERLLESCGGSPELAKFYLGVESKLWHEVAQQSAKAVQGMQPKITQWHTGGGGKQGSSVSDSIVGLVQGVVPLYEQVKDHFKKPTVYSVPSNNNNNNPKK